MDSVNNWKKILLQWVKECNFLEKTFYSIDQSEIEIFFTHFKDSFKEKKNICQYKNLSDFLKDEYPLYEPHYDDENILSSSDHIYVYSLLLHYSCVKVSDAFFQGNCQALNEVAQRNITAFFQKLLTEDSLTKETLRHVIASIHVFTPPNNNRFIYTAESPLRTPRKQTGISPPTPRSCMLQERNKKVYSLNAQLETLGYEKNVLEADLKNYQDKIDKLNQELKRSNQEILDLKNEMHSRSRDSGDSGIRHTGEEQIRRLSKKISQKEQEIAKQRETIEELTEQKDFLNEKLKNAEKQMKLLQSNITDLAEKVDDLSIELEEKERTIQSLSDTKTELEHYISEIRSSTVNSRPDLNMSSEFLDLSRATNSSGSIHSPENLGSVVDIKLREKEHENEKLREEISLIRIDNSKLSKAMSELTSRYSKLFDICNENLIINDTDDEEEHTTDLSNYFIIFSNYMQSFASKYEENCFELKRIKETEKQIEEQNLKLASKLEETQNQNIELRKEVEELLSANKLLQTSKASLENAVLELETKLESCLKERSEEANNFKNLQKELNNLKTEKLNTEHQVEYLTTCLETNEDILTKLQSDNGKKDVIISENQQKFKEFDSEKQFFEKKIIDFEHQEKDLLEQLNYEVSQRSEFEEENINLSNELEKSKQNYANISHEKNYLLTLTQGNAKQIDVLQQKIQKLTADQSLKASIISKLETDKESLIDSMQEKVHNLSNLIDKYEEGFEQKTNELNELTRKLLQTEDERNSRQNELQEISLQLDRQNEAFSKATQCILYHVNNLKFRLGLEANINPALLSCDIDDIEKLDSKLKLDAKCLVDDIASVCDHVMEEKASLRQKTLELENLHEEQSSMKENVVHLEAERVKLISNTETSIKKEAALQNELKLMTLSIEKLEKDLCNKTKDAEVLLEKHNQSEEMVKKLQDKILRIENDSILANERMKENNIQLETTKTQLDSEIAEKLVIKEELSKTSEMLNQVQSKIILMETELADMKEISSKTSNELSQEFDRTKILLKNEATDKQQIKKELERAKIEFENELQSIKLQSETVASEAKEVQKELESTKFQLDSEVTEKQQLKENFECAKSEFENKLKIIDLQSETVTLEAKETSKKLETIKLQLQSEVTEKQQIKEDLESAKTEFENKLQSINLQSEAVASEAKEIRKELESTKLQLESEVTEKQQIKEDLESAKTEFENKLQSINLQSEAVASEAKEIRKELESTKLQLESEVTEKQQIKEDLESAKTDFENKLQSINLQSEAVASEAKEIRKELESTKLQLESEVTEKQQLKSEFENKLKIINLQSETVASQAKEIRKELESMKLQLETEKHQIKEDLERVKIEFENKLKSINLQSETAALEAKEVQKELESTKLQLESEIIKKQQIIEDLQNVRHKLVIEGTENQTLKEDLERLRNEFVSQELQNKQQLQAKVTQYHDENHRKISIQLETEVKKTKSLIEDLANAKVQLENEVKNKHRLTELLEETKFLLENEVTAYKMDLENVRIEKSKITEEFESTKLQLEDEVTEKNQIKENLKETEFSLERNLAENQKVKKELDSVKIELEQKVLENQQMKEELESIKHQLEIKFAETLNIKEDLENTNKALKQLQSKVIDLKTENETHNKLSQNTKLQLENEAATKTEMKNKFDMANEELKDLQTKILNLETENESVNQKAEEYNRQLEDVKCLLKNEETEKSKVTEAFENANKQMNELENQKIDLGRKYQAMIREVEKYKNDLQLTECEITRLQTQECHLREQIEILKSTNESQIRKCNKEVEEQKDNVSRLIQEIASIRKEKEFAEEEKKILSNRLESKLDEQKSNETNHRSIEEKLQLAQKEILVNLNILKTEQLKSQDLENQLKKLQTENAKLRESAESNMKRIEKQALMLGESQAKCQKLKKESEAAQSNYEMLKSSTDSTHRENSRLNQECKSLKEKLSKSEKSKDQLESRIQLLQKEIEKLEEEKKIVETSENDLKTSKASLEKVKLNLEDKIRKLAKSLSDSNVALSKVEQDKVQLNLEVGGLNKQLEDNKTLLSMKLKEIETLTSNLHDAESTNSQLIEQNEKHQSKAKEIDEENSRLNDQLSKLSLRLQITQEGHESMKSELESLKSDVEASKLERDAIEKDHRSAVERLMGIEGRVVEERLSTEFEFNNQIKLLEDQISKLSAEKCDLEKLRIQDKLIIEHLNEDIAIFKAKLQKSRGICEENEKKWADEKEVLLAEVKGGDDRIKETRLELEGKLEKMKNKMKTLYNDEVAKMKKKQEREVAVYKTDIDSLNAKNDKHEAHIKKLSNQIFRLNENILEFQKENTFLKTKLKDLENKPRQFNRIRPTSSASAHQVLSSNLRMEDEEGEIFNNTYLSDLKDGRMSEYFNTDICAQELQYRNSLVPPHLKSTYLAQFDHQMGEEEIRDTPTLDDSSSTLLNTGQRKKVSGATSYKRPGPPTPSKNAGRLSFGGIGELNREILKESLDMASCSSSSTSKTPAKFKFFSSKLSMRGDERKSYVTNFKQKLLRGATMQCSSTPRKSKAHIDQRRLLDQIMSTASPGSEYSPDSIVKPAVNLPSSLKNLELKRRMSSLYKWRQPGLSYASDSGNSDVNSPRRRDSKYVSSGSKKRSTKRSKDRRGSIYLRGSMFARNCRTPTLGTRELYKTKSKSQRNANFNKFRPEVLDEGLIKKASLCPSWDEEECNNNNNDDDFFLQEANMKEHVIDNENSYGDNSHEDDDVNNDKTSKHFQQLLAAKASNAPFEISEIKASPSCSNVNNSSSNVHSRTIYGASVILNRKIPNVCTTMVRKSSIYVKGSDGKSVILVTNQTITLKDLAQMWLQMNVSAKSVIAFSLTATLIGLVAFFIQFIDR